MLRDPLPREGSAHPASLLRTCVSGAEPDTWLAVSIETLVQLEAGAATRAGRFGTDQETSRGQRRPPWNSALTGYVVTSTLSC